MPENEFEKKIQDRLDSLNLEPSAAVWEQVEFRIRKDRRRRWFIWIPLLVAGIGAGTWIVSDQLNNNKAAKNHSDTNATLRTNPVDNAVSQGKDLKKSEEILVNQQQSNNKEKKTTGVFVPNEEVKFARTHKEAIIIDYGAKKNSHPANERSTSGNDDAVLQTGGEETLIAAGASGSQAGSNSSSTNITTDSAASTKQVHDSSAVTKKEEKKAATALNHKKAKSWTFGLMAGGGLSAQSEGLLGSSQGTMSALYAGNYPPPHQKAPLKSALAFSFGGYAEKKLNRSLSIQLGLVYTQYSSSFETGNQVNNTAFITVSAYRYMSISNYYQAQAQNNGSSVYHNRYHFLEMPVDLNVRLNPSGKTAFRWEIGLTPGYLVSTNALHYDEQQNIYYSDNSLFNKMQLGFNTALSVRVFEKSKHPLWLGPEFRSTMTNLTNQKNTNGNHLYYGGVKASFRLFKSEP